MSLGTEREIQRARDIFYMQSDLDTMKTFLLSPLLHALHSTAIAADQSP